MKKISDQLIAATTTLLGGSLHSAHAIENAWDLDSSYVTYSEADDRVTVNKAIVKLSGDITDDDRATISLVLDTMSGSTPSGTVKSNNSSVSSYTGASGAVSNIDGATSPDKVEFEDTRLAFTLDWENRLTHKITMNYGGSISVEHDYQSLGASASMKYDNDSRSRTWTAGLAVSNDSIFLKTGGTPKPLSNVEDNIIYSDGERVTYDIIAGVSQVLNRRTVGEINYTLSLSDGYHTDPYKVISSVRLVGESGNDTYTYSELDRYYESRPDTRQRNTLYTGLVHRYGEHKGEVIHASYRFYTDDWGITAHTLEVMQRNPLGKGRYIEPQVRFYTQSAADFFYHHLLYDDPALPQYASADYRLDKMFDTTIGVQYGQPLAGGSLRARVAYIEQHFDNSEYDLNIATIFQISYRKQFD